MNFGQAIEAIKDDQRVTRAGWNGKGMWLKLSRPGPHDMVVPHVLMLTVDARLVPWTCSQTDMPAEDWEMAE